MTATTTTARDPLYLLAVDHHGAVQLSTGRTRQLSRNFPCEPQFIDRWVAIQATTVSAMHRKPGLLAVPTWTIAAVGKLTGVGYHPGISRDREDGFGRAYKRKTGQAGPWVWTFSNVVALDPIPYGHQPEMRGSAEVAGRRWSWVDEGHGDWWSCCLRSLDVATVDRVREARRKVSAK